MIFGQTSCKLEYGATTIQLEHTILDPNFFKPVEIKHQSPLTGVRTYSHKWNEAQFSILEYLFDYDAATAQTLADQLLGIENQEVIFTPFNKLWSRKVIVSMVDVYPLTKPYKYDVARIDLVSCNYSYLAGYLKLGAGRWTTKDGKHVRRSIGGLP